MDQNKSPINTQTTQDTQPQNTKTPANKSSFDINRYIVESQVKESSPLPLVLSCVAFGSIIILYCGAILEFVYPSTSSSSNVLLFFVMIFIALVSLGTATAAIITGVIANNSRSSTLGIITGVLVLVLSTPVILLMLSLSLI